MSHIQPTSREANEKSKPKRPTNHQKILSALQHLLKHEGTADMIATCTTFDKIEVSRRMKELQRDGKVIDTGRKGITAKGCKAIIWKLSNVKQTPKQTQTQLFD